MESGHGDGIFEVGVTRPGHDELICEHEEMIFGHDGTISARADLIYAVAEWIYGPDDLIYEPADIINEVADMIERHSRIVSRQGGLDRLRASSDQRAARAVELRTAMSARSEAVKSLVLLE
jgi:hypothetical protein